MIAISEYERAAVERRITALREAIYALGHETLSPSERAASLRAALSELRELQELLTSNAPSAARP